MHPASICLPTERATVSTNKTLAFLETHRVDFVLELRPGYAEGGMTGITPGSELLFLEVQSTSISWKKRYSYSYPIILGRLLLLLLVHYATQAQQGMWYKMTVKGQ